MLALEDLGTVWHPAPCRRLCDGLHRSRTFAVAGWLVWATYGDDWQVEVHTVGDGPLSKAEGDYLERVYAHLHDPAALRATQDEPPTPERTTNHVRHP
jgi:hypothetical protein